MTNVLVTEFIDFSVSFKDNLHVSDGFLHDFSGNILSALVARRKHLRGSNVSFFLRILAVVETVNLWIGLLRQWMK